MRRLALAIVLAIVPWTVAPALDGAVAARLAPLPASGSAVAGTVSNGAEPWVTVLADGVVLVGDTAGLHRSADGGATWTTAPDFSFPGLFTDGWPIAVDAAGTVYTARTQGQVVAVGASHDEGRSWSTTDKVVDAAPVADRPWVAARNAGEVVVLDYGSPVGEVFSYSSDGGATFLSRTLNNEGGANAGNAQMDASGHIWFSNGYDFERWDPQCQGKPALLWVGGHGKQVFTQLAVAGGDEYAAMPRADNGDMRIVAAQGLDPASVKELAVSSPTLRSNTYGAIAASPDGSTIAVAWYGSATAGDPSGSFAGSWDTYVARVTGFWTATPTIQVTKVTATPNHSGGFCMSGLSCTSGRALLDYIGVALGPDGSAHVAYGDDSSGSAVVRYARIA
jgi:hypothetical protein